jgi:hypothetical protein
MPPCLNRLLVVVTPKEPFAKWVAGTDPRDKSPPTLADVRRESTACLIEECDMETEYQRTLRRHFRVIFDASASKALPAYHQKRHTCQYAELGISSCSEETAKPCQASRARKPEQTAGLATRRAQDPAHVARGPNRGGVSSPSCAGRRESLDA